MIIKEFYKTRADGVNLYRSYSDAGMRIHKVDTDEFYDEAIDIADVPFEYEETNIPIDSDDEEFTDKEFRALVESVL
jgi:hypothetical protein